MRRLITLLLVLAGAAVAAGALAPLALAAPDPVVVDCTSHNRLTRQYTVIELRHGLSTMSADVKQYTSCNDVLQRALDAQLGGLHATGGGSSSGGGGSFLPTPLILVLVALLLVGATFGALSLRRRGQS